jgi:hypothetical protein
MIAKLALVWLHAEHTDVARDAELSREPGATVAAKALRADVEKRVWTPDELAEATDRVLEVIRGDVRWRDTTPGDRAVWKGRMRNVETFGRRLGVSGATPPPGALADLDEPTPPPPRDRMSRGGPRLYGYRQRLWWNYYDTVEVNPRLAWARMFDNNNVGNIFLSNMQLAGQLAGDFVMAAWYVSIDRFDALEWAASNVCCEVVVGDKPMSPRMFVRDLFMTVVPTRPVIVPVRQNFSVTMNARTDRWPEDLDPFEVTFHIEGLQTRDVT